MSQSIEPDSCPTVHEAARDMVDESGNWVCYCPDCVEVIVDYDDDECVHTYDSAGGNCPRRDDRHHYEMVEVRRLGAVESRYVRGRCLHRHLVGVESGGEQVARLCLTCDAQLPA